MSTDDFQGLIFSGSIYPEMQAKAIRFKMPMTISEPKIGDELKMISAEIYLEIENGKFICKIPGEVVNNSGDTHLFKLRNSVIQIVNQVLDAINFAMSSYLEADVECVFFDGEVIFDFRGIRPELVSSEYFQSIEEVEDWCLKALSMQDGLNLRHALSDYRRAIKYQTECAMHCYRAIESVRHYFQVSSTNRNQSWGSMKGKLNLSPTWLKQFEEYATAQRHGQLVELTGEQVKKMLDVTWLTIKRFADYLEGQDVQALPTLES